MKKKVSIITIVFIILSALIAILGLFSVIKLKGVFADLLFTFLTLSVSGILTLNSCSMLEKKNKLAIVSLSLIVTSALLVIIALWSNAYSSSLYINITLTFCILSVCFNLITSSNLKLHKKYLVIQIISYLCFTITAIFLILISWGSDILKDNLKVFILFIILSLLALGILAILSKKQNIIEIDNDKDYVKIRKKEYNELIKIKNEYERMKVVSNDQLSKQKE